MAENKVKTIVFITLFLIMFITTTVLFAISFDTIEVVGSFFSFLGISLYLIFQCLSGLWWCMVPVVYLDPMAFTSSKRTSRL